MDIMFQTVFNLIQNKLPENWEKMAFFASYFDGGYMMKYYVRIGGNYQDCYDLSPESEVEMVFSEIDKVIEPERAKLDDKKRWNVFTMIVSNDGSMKSEFEYKDISDDEIEYIKSWKKKYLD